MSWPVMYQPRSEVASSSPAATSPSTQASAEGRDRPVQDDPGYAVRGEQHADPDEPDSESAGADRQDNVQKDIAKAREESHGLGLFVRSLVGLDRAAATQAFDRYLADTSFSASQLRFINLIVEHLTANGNMEVARLYESPFTDNAPQGPESIFTEDQVDDIVTILGDVRDRALPDVTVA